METYEKKLRWLQLLRDFSGCDEHQGDAQEGRNNRLIILGPRDLQFKTWYLNNGRLRTWPCVLWVKIDGKELNVMRRKKLGRVPKFEEERRRFKELVFVSTGFSSFGG